MTAKYVTVAVINIPDPQKRWEGLFPVDTGANQLHGPCQPAASPQSDSNQ